MTQDESREAREAGEHAGVSEDERQERLTQLERFPAIFAEHRSFVEDLLRKGGVESHEVMDLLQEVFVTLHAQILEIGVVDSIPAMLHTLTHAPNRDRVWTEAVIEIGRAVEQLLASSYPQEYQLPQPSYKNAATRRLSEQLRDAQNRRNALKNAGQATREVDNELLTLRRELREGGQLRAGDAFADGRFLLLEAVGRGGYA